MKPKITTKELTPALWPEIQKLFGKNGACGGCWCMYWRKPKDVKWEDLKGERAKKEFKALVVKKKAHGVLAFDQDEPVAWCSFDRRTDYDRLDRSPSLACEDAKEVWSTPCFFVKSGYRNQGIGKQLLKAALQLMKRKKVKRVEGYPIKPTKDGNPYPAAFAYTGTRSMFIDAGFKIVGNRDGGKQRVRKDL